jgi:hypothetical protein
MTLEAEDCPKTSLLLHQTLQYSLEYVKSRKSFYFNKLID